MAESHTREHIEELARSIRGNVGSETAIHHELMVSDRVLARITDGIYRQPSSALRELISNAYDADATYVEIQTDAPRFETIRIRDDGLWMDPEALASLITQIGGSAKRTRYGVELGIAQDADPRRSPSGRTLIGKIGIGLFAVAQLTSHFQIITKKAGAEFSLVADVVLLTYTEDELADIGSTEDQEFRSGAVQIWAVTAKDVESHGTEIVLLELRKQAKDILRSVERWDAHQPAEIDPTAEGLPLPKYHIGRIAPGTTDIIANSSILPWDDSTDPSDRFSCLFQAVLDEVGVSVPHPTLYPVLDNYLNTLWTLALSAPVDYIESNPFDLTGADIVVFELSNSPRGQAVQVSLGPTESIREHFNYTSPERGSVSEFKVYVDEIELKRPLRFRGLVSTSHAIKNPLLFVGRWSPDLTQIPKELRGGPLSLEGYFLWAPKIVPRDHTGVLIRIADASGTLFDETFLRYQVAEVTRLRQITGEVFVKVGLDPALNIDRESFNYSHPHYRALSIWVHGSLRQIANAQKAIGQGLRRIRRDTEEQAQVERLREYVDEEWRRTVKDEDRLIPDVIIGNDIEQVEEARNRGDIAFLQRDILPSRPSGDRVFVAKAEAVARILEAYGIFEDMEYERQQRLVAAIVRIFMDA